MHPEHNDDRPIRVVNTTNGKELVKKLEIAGTGPKRSRGLLGRRGLETGQALWIVPCEAVHTFGMQFTLDLVYLDKEHRVKKIVRNIPPWRISGCLTAHSVIELAAGSILEADVQPGDQLEFIDPENIGG